MHSPNDSTVNKRGRRKDDEYYKFNIVLVCGGVAVYWWPDLIAIFLNGKSL